MAENASTDNNSKSMSLWERIGWFAFAAALCTVGALFLIPSSLNLLVMIAGIALLAGGAYTIYEAFKPDKKPQNLQYTQSPQYYGRVQATTPVHEPEQTQEEIEKELDPSWGPPNFKLPLPPLKEPEPIPSPKQLAPEPASSAPAARVNNVSAAPTAATAGVGQST